MKDEMGRTNGIYVGEKKWTQGFGVKPMHRGKVLESTISIISQVCVNVQFLCTSDAKTAH